MRDHGSPDYEAPPPDQTLQAWLADSAKDWAVSQPTLWLPAVPAEPPPVVPTIPEQRGSRRHRAAAADVGRARPLDPAPTPGTAGAEAEPPERRARAAAARTLLTVTLLLLAVLAVGLALSSAAWAR
ncbi:MAG TPA: hypothetical protein VL595_20810 [Pseudonocardia sp.]|nr:hypothetical protein [Pseudonocardia sp.]